MITTASPRTTLPRALTVTLAADNPLALADLIAPLAGLMSPLMPNWTWTCVRPTRNASTKEQSCPAPCTA